MLGFQDKGMRRKKVKQPTLEEYRRQLEQQIYEKQQREAVAQGLEVPPPNRLASSSEPEALRSLTAGSNHEDEPTHLPPRKVQSMVDVKSQTRKEEVGDMNRQETSHSQSDANCAVETPLPYPTPKERPRRAPGPSYGQSCGGGASSIGDMLGYGTSTSAHSRGLIEDKKPQDEPRPSHHDGLPGGGDHVRKLRIVNGKIIKGSYKNAPPDAIQTQPSTSAPQATHHDASNSHTTRPDRDQGTALGIPGIHRKMVQPQSQEEWRLALAQQAQEAVRRKEEEMRREEERVGFVSPSHRRKRQQYKEDDFKAIPIGNSPKQNAKPPNVHEDNADEVHMGLHLAPETPSREETGSQQPQSENPSTPKRDLPKREGGPSPGISIPMSDLERMRAYNRKLKEERENGVIEKEEVDFENENENAPSNISPMEIDPRSLVPGLEPQAATAKNVSRDQKDTHSSKSGSPGQTDNASVNNGPQNPPKGRARNPGTKKKVNRGAPKEEKRISVAEKRRQMEEKKREEREQKLREKELKQKQALLEKKKKRDHGAQAAHRAYQAQRDIKKAGHDKKKKKVSDEKKGIGDGGLQGRVRQRNQRKAKARRSQSPEEGQTTESEEVVKVQHGGPRVSVVNADMDVQHSTDPSPSVRSRISDAKLQDEYYRQMSPLNRKAAATNRAEQPEDCHVPPPRKPRIKTTALLPFPVENASPSGGQELSLDTMDAQWGESLGGKSLLLYPSSFQDDASYDPTKYGSPSVGSTSVNAKRGQSDFNSSQTVHSDTDSLYCGYAPMSQQF